ncbi:MAG: hypothetical protein AAGE18_00265 [Pseudomonadota bacterium]
MPLTTQDTPAALELSQEGIALWLRSAAGWTEQLRVPVNDAARDPRLAEMRQILGRSLGRVRPVALWLPMSEALEKRAVLSATSTEDRLDEAAASIAASTSHGAAALALALGPADADGKTPITAVPLRTVEEAREFAAGHGFRVREIALRDAAQQTPICLEVPAERRSRVERRRAAVLAGVCAAIGLAIFRVVDPFVLWPNPPRVTASVVIPFAPGGDDLSFRAADPGLDVWAPARRALPPDPAELEATAPARPGTIPGLPEEQPTQISIADGALPPAAPSVEVAALQIDDRIRAAAPQSLPAPTAGEGSPPAAPAEATDAPADPAESADGADDPPATAEEIETGPTDEPTQAEIAAVPVTEGAPPLRPTGRPSAESVTVTEGPPPLLPPRRQPADVAEAPPATAEDLAAVEVIEGRPSLRPPRSGPLPPEPAETDVAEADPATPEDAATPEQGEEVAIREAIDAAQIDPDRPLSPIALAATELAPSDMPRPRWRQPSPQDLDPDLAPTENAPASAMAMRARPIEIVLRVAALRSSADVTPPAATAPTIETAPLTQTPAPPPQTAEPPPAESTPPATTTAALAPPAAAPPVEEEATVPRRVGPRPATPTAVAQAATIPDAINLDAISLIGVYGSTSSRRALIRLPNGRFVRVARGGNLDGWEVLAIDEDSLRLRRGRETRTLNIPD